MNALTTGVRATLGGFALSALAACAVGPDYRAPQPPVVEAAAPSGDADYSTAEPVARFWTVFGDPTLDALQADAQQANPELRVALANLNAARALRREVRLDAVPTVSAGAGYVRGQQSTAQAPGLDRDARTGELHEASFDAFWELDFFGRVRRANESARAGEAAVAAELQHAQVSVAAELARTYFELRGAQTRLSVAQRNAENQAGTAAYTQARLEHGSGTELDHARAIAQLKATQARLPELRIAVSNAIHRLAVLTGRTPEALDAVLRPTAALPALPRLVQIGAPEDLLRRRADVAAAERRLAAATANIGVATAALFPQVRFVGEVGFSVADTGDIGDAGSEFHAFGPRISWAAFDLGRVRARIDQAEARADGALARYEQTVLRALEEHANALHAYGQQRRRLDLLDTGAQASARAAELAGIRFDGGASDFLDVLDAERSLLEAEDRLAFARTETATALVAVYKSLGGGWDVPQDVAAR